VTGFGLGRFQVEAHSVKTSHSEYISIVVGTGVVGATFYFGCYLLLLLRLYSGARLAREPNLVLRRQLVLSMLLVILIVAIGRPNYENALTWTVLGIATQLASREMEESRSPAASSSVADPPVPSTRPPGEPAAVST
jgi:O-antigen ligase